VKTIKDKRVSLHTYRHMCTKIYIGGRDIFSLGELLGSSLVVCRDYVALWGGRPTKIYRKYSLVESVIKAELLSTIAL
jgi:hypothetical protein